MLVADTVARAPSLKLEPAVIETRLPAVILPLVDTVCVLSVEAFSRTLFVALNGPVTVVTMLPEEAVMLIELASILLVTLTAVLPDAAVPVTDTVPKPVLSTLVLTTPAATVRFCPALKEPRAKAFVPLFSDIEPEPLPFNRATLLVAVSRFAVPPDGKLTSKRVEALTIPAAVWEMPPDPEVKPTVGPLNAPPMLTVPLPAASVLSPVPIRLPPAAIDTLPVFEVKVVEPLPVNVPEMVTLPPAPVALRFAVPPVV